MAILLLLLVKFVSWEPIFINGRLTDNIFECETECYFGPQNFAPNRCDYTVTQKLDTKSAYPIWDDRVVCTFVHLHFYARTAFTPHPIASQTHRTICALKSTAFTAFYASIRILAS